MKPGAESDPFDDDPVDSTPAEVDTEPDHDVKTGPRATSTVATTQEPPYILRRSTVKEGREPVQFFLREQFIDGEREFRRELEERLETDVKKSDLREAAYAFAQEHPEEVAKILRKWGYEYR